MVSIVEYIYLIFRILIVFCGIMLIIRVLGKREVGQLSIFDLVVLLLIADLGSIGIDDENKFYVSLIGLAVLLILQKIFSFLTIKFSSLRSLFEGDPTIIVQNGKINLKAMKKEMYSVDDLITQIREKKIMDLSEVSLAVLETNGTLSVFRKAKYSKIRLPIILSGKICNENLDYFNMTKDEIITFINSKKIDIENIIYASYDNDFVYFYEKNNNKTLLTLKKLDWKRQN